MLHERFLAQTVLDQIMNCTCCHGEEYQPMSTAVEVVLPGIARGSSGHGPRLQPRWRSTKGLAIFLHLRMGNSTYLCRRGHVIGSKWLVLQSFPILNSDSEDSTSTTQWGLKYLCRTIKLWGMPWCAVEGAYPPCESLSPQRSSLFWMPEPQDLEHWKRVQAGGTILENELRVCVRGCVGVMWCEGNRHHKVTCSNRAKSLPQKVLHWVFLSHYFW